MSSLVRLVLKFSEYLKFNNLFALNRIEPMFALNVSNAMTRNENESEKSIIEEIMENGMFWAVPKQRRPVERRLARRFGVPEYPDTSRIIRPKENITVCDNCGEYHEIHTLCAHCYDKVREETKLIQEAINKQLNNTFEPIQQEVAILYKHDERNENMDRKRIVEMDRERPEWFSQNLLSKSKSNKWTESNITLKEDEPEVKY